MAQASFIHLRNHSDYSLLQGSMSVAKLIDMAVQNDMPAVALTDKNNLFGAYEFSIKAKAKGIQPIIGLEAIMQDTKNLDARAKDNTEEANPTDINQSKLILIAQNQEGYENLRSLVSNAYMQNDGSDISFAWGDIKDYSKGIICLSGGITGAIGQAVLHDQHEQAKTLCIHLQQIFGDRFYLEIERHGLMEEKTSEASFLKLSDSLGIPIVATNDCGFASPDMHVPHDILTCIGENYQVNDKNRPRISGEHYFKNEASMQELYADLPDALENSVAIAKRCGFALEQIPPALPTYKKLGGRSEIEALTQLANEGLDKRLQDSKADRKPYDERLKYELDVINNMGFCGYFLIVADFTQWAKNHNIPVGPGRGSGAGSLVSWALAITDLDPLDYGLLFERFLNPERVSMPDFDIDFCQDMREHVIKYVQDEYGAENVAQIATFGRLQSRAVLRDVGRVLGMHYGHVDRICKMVPNNPADPKTLEEVMKSEPVLVTEYKNDPQVRQLIDMAKKLEGLCRNVGTHAAGIVIGDKPLSQMIPLYRDPRSDMMVTQFNMKDVENVGLVKFDFLGLKTLTVIDKSLKFIEKSGNKIDIGKIPLDDKKTFKFLCEKSATGVFQLESSGMQDVMRQVQPDRLEDLIAIVALYRPGPMENIPTYIKRKHGKEDVAYPHPLLQEVLEETFGIPVYQEQVMQIAQKLAGYTLGNADLLRRAMGKKDRAEMDAQKQKFLTGAKTEHNIDEKQATEIFELIRRFAEYGFNKTHAAAYALLAYQTAYLKTHHPTEFMTALLCLDSGNTERLEILIDECRKMDIELRPADINKSDVNFSIDIESNGEDKMFIRYGLSALKGVGKSAMEAIISVRESGGAFNSIYDFFERCDYTVLNKRLLENLIRSGAFDSLNPNRRQMLMGLEHLRNYSRAFHEQQSSDQSFLFEATGNTQDRPVLPEVEDWTGEDRAKGELESVGFYLSEHPLSAYAERLERMGVKSGAEIISPDFKNKQALISAVIMAIRVIRTKQGKKIAFIRVSDLSSNFEITAYDETIDRYMDLLQEHRLIFAKVGIKHEEGKENRLQLLDISLLDDKLGNMAESLELAISEPEALKSLQQVLNDHSQKGKGSVFVMLKGREIWGSSVDVTLDLGVSLNLTEDLRRAVKSLAGIEEISS